jgi:hypothetical protein
MKVTYRKTRKGETIDIRADKGEDLRGIVEAMGKPHVDDELCPACEHRPCISELEACVIPLSEHLRMSREVFGGPLTSRSDERAKK